MTSNKIPHWALTAAVDGLQEFATRLEVEAAELTKLDTPEARIAVQARMEKAWEVKQANKFLMRL